MLLTADLHLTDAPADEYRWDVFRALTEAAVRLGENHIGILGDITDRKDRHSAALVNRLVGELLALREVIGTYGVIDIIMGNHDEPLRGAPFWSFLHQLPGIRFHTEPTVVEDGRLLLLPYSPNPVEAWEGLDLTAYKAVFIHQLVTGVVVDGKELTADKHPLPPLPPKARIYAGDIHAHQKVGPVQYIGAPHPVKFGDDYPCRLLVLDDETYRITNEIKLDPMRKHMLDVGSMEELNGKLLLDRWPIKQGDQARIRYTLPLADIGKWARIKDDIAAWAREHEVVLFSLEAVVEAGERAPAGAAAPNPFTAPGAVYDAFCAHEQLDAELVMVGREILSSVIEA